MSFLEHVLWRLNDPRKISDAEINQPLREVWQMILCRLLRKSVVKMKNRSGIRYKSPLNEVVLSADLVMHHLLTAEGLGATFRMSLAVSDHMLYPAMSAGKWTRTQVVDLTHYLAELIRDDKLGMRFKGEYDEESL